MSLVFERWFMKSRFGAILAVLALAFSSVLSISALAQTTEEGPAPSDQPSAPMEIGQSGPTADPSMDAQPSDAQPTEAEPGGPSGEAPAQTDQGVARVSLIHGDVSTQRGDSGDWSAATLNQPVMTGDKVSTADNARTELQLDFANIIRLGPNSKANVSNLTKKQIQIQLAEGIANYTVSKDSEAEPEIDTPNVSIHPAHHDGVFRVEVRPDGDTIVIVRQGEAQIATPQGSTELQAGDMATVRGNADSAQYKISQAPDRDDWDRWNSDRDHMIRNASSWHHTNRRYTGSQDLDAYGNWKNVPDYGDVWVPNEPDGWVPYRNGNWTYEPYYGWTWVGYEPWGWAPYHYGRWFPYRWCMGVVAWPGLCGLQPVLVARIRFILRLGRRLWFRRRLRRLGRLWLASNRTVRLLPSMVGWIPRPLRRSRLPWRVQPVWRIRASAWRKPLLEHHATFITTTLAALCRR